MFKEQNFYFHIFGYVSGSIKTFFIFTIIPLSDSRISAEVSTLSPAATSSPLSVNIRTVSSLTISGDNSRIPPDARSATVAYGVHS